ncbi:MAG: transporter [Gammaproteobacteria bacterium]|nr:MAG: transporter [Gammaproteobacteria bacterium]
MNIAEIISPLIFIASLGFICAKTKWLSKNQLDGISKLTFNIFIPAFLFFSMANAKLDQTLDFGFFLGFYFPVLLCFFIAATSNYFLNAKYHHDLQASAVFALASSYSNTVIVGLPILVMLFGEQAIILIFAIVTFHSALLFTLTSALSTQNQQLKWYETLLNTFNNPLLISILAGALINLLGLTLPTIINESLKLLTKPAITLALFILGASLTFYPLRKGLKFVALATLIKLLLLPLIVYLSASYFFHLSLIQIKVLVVLSACPTGVNAYLIAKNAHTHEQTVATTVVASTLLSVITLSFWLWWLS